MSLCLQVFEQFIQAGFVDDAGSVALIQLCYAFLQLFTQVRQFGGNEICTLTLLR